MLHAPSLSNYLFMKKAAEYLSSRDIKLSGIISEIGIIEQKLNRDLFFSLVESILSQQLSPKAADSIIRRFVELYQGDSVRASSIDEFTDDQLRSCGISRQKVTYIRSVAEEFATGRLDGEKLGNMSDTEVVEELVTIKGVGPWTAKMILIFTLGRPDVLPHEDLGIVNAISKLYGPKKTPGRKAVERIAKNWHPYCSVASLYLWKLKDELPWDREY